MNTEALNALLSQLRSRGQVKALGARVDREPALRAALEALAIARGIELEGEETGKRLVRVVLERGEGAQVRSNPIRRDEAFTCASCGAEVSPGGARVRDHCPCCLRGLHVDRVPGDRAAGCAGVLEPEAFELRGGEVRISWRCLRCGASYSGRAHPEDALPPSLSVADLLPLRAAGGSIVDPSPPAGRERTLPLRVLEVIRARGLWRPGARVLVAVSGGVDSLALLDLLVETAGGHGGRLEVASVDHGLRPEAAHEVLAVGELARARGLPFHPISLGLAPGAALALRAREARRAALLACGADRICTAHHADDQAETILQHLLRGAGGRGLRGMVLLDAPWCRPLLFERRATLEAWARCRELSWIEDPSNPTSQRGRLRALMPALDQIHGDTVGALARAARLLGREEGWMEALTTEAWSRLYDGEGLRLPELQAEHPALQLRLLRRLCQEAGVVPRADQLEALLDPAGPRRLGLAGGYAIETGGGRVRLRVAKEAT